jgi:hypothetical protein
MLASTVEIYAVDAVQRQTPARRYASVADMMILRNTSFSNGALVPTLCLTYHGIGVSDHLYPDHLLAICCKDCLLN